MVLDDASAVNDEEPIDCEVTVPSRDMADLLIDPTLMSSLDMDTAPPCDAVIELKVEVSSETSLDQIPSNVISGADVTIGEPAGALAPRSEPVGTSASSIDSANSTTTSEAKISTDFPMLMSSLANKQPPPPQRMLSL
ncbi:unnamed protein product [Haemonchus placei]|uniref:Uncharacterized protein n=1 Tax=Haemonchus placei TaxID=6290 RepID=A0A0N4WGL7_HAEPC|nr:unnamed protein product [Haemonchus placei]